MWKPKLQSVVSLYIVANSISWFLLTLVFIMDIISNPELNSGQPLTLSAAYFGGLIVSALIGGTILARTLRKKLSLLTWNIFGVFACLLLYYFYPQFNFAQPTLLLIAVLAILSFSIGLGIPTCLSLFSMQTKTEKRGRIGAVVFFSIQIIAAIILLIIDGQEPTNQLLVFAVWRMLGLFGITFYRHIEEKPEESEISLISIAKQRRFILLFLPWFMFALINYIEVPVLQVKMGPDVYNNYNVVSNVISSIVAIPAGFLCDLKGRKITAIAGFIFLGLGYAFLSIFSGITSIGISPYFFFMVFDGVAWGILYVTFIFVIWGDLSEGKSREKYYFLGGLPFLLSGLIQSIFQQPAQNIDPSTSFSVASIFLFVAILPLIFAPETMSEKIMKDRELSNYIQKALSTADKKNKQAKQKSKKTDDNNMQSNDTQEREQVETYEEKQARELAEKYY